MTIELTESERKFLKDALDWSEHGYEEKSARYMHGPGRIEGYYKEIYLPKKAEFTAMQSKLNKPRREG